MQNKKILYFDYWTVGLHNFKLFDHELKEKGYETKLVHIASWRNKNSPVFQEIDGIKCYDIAYYKTNFIYKVLEIERPQVVVTLNASYITDRSVILACKKLGIKVVYLMHGILTREQFIEDNIESTNPSLKKNRLLKAYNHLHGTVLNYLYSLLKYDFRYLFRWHPYNILLRTFSNPGMYLNFPPPSFDLQPDLVLVYGNIDNEFYKKRILDEKSRIEVVGNPGLDRYFSELERLGDDKDAFLKSNNIPLDKPFVTYLDESLVEDSYWDNEHRLAFYRTIAEACREAGLNLVIKLHPKTAKGPYADSIKQLPNITVITEVNFPKLIFFTKKCISHYSSTLIYPILLNKPILVPRWGRSAKLANIYTEKEVTFLSSIEALKEHLNGEQTNYDRKVYLDEYVSFTDGKTKERIVKYILELAQ